MARRNYHGWREITGDLKERLRDTSSWFPYPLMISFGLAIIFTGHLLLGLNPRLGNPASVLSFPAQEQKDGAIWISLSPVGDELVATTSERKVYRWPLQVASMDPLSGFVSYLKQRVTNETISVALEKEATKRRTSVTLAVDQRLKYLHIRPVLYALAEAKISNYSFETKLLDDSQGGH